jgi:enoyl-[acyl-carrier-protein] reductase (NADH)
VFIKSTRSDSASTSEGIAEAVIFLAGPAPRYMTGSIVSVDAGFRVLVSIAPSDTRR